jgi:tartrate-resistant acid phosphatase type 5
VKHPLCASLLAVAVLATACDQGHEELEPHRDLGAAVADGAPPPSDDVYFAAIGDFGSNEDSELWVSQLVERRDPQFVITLGDNNYPSGERSTIDTNIGQYYSKYIGGYMGRYGLGSPINLFFPCVGNHEWYSSEGVQPHVDYFSELPGNRRYFDFQMGLVHFYVVDSDDHEPDGIDLGSTQAQWLEETLAKPTTACYKIVYFHHPPYSSGIYAWPRIRWPFAKWGADAIIAGHDHIYERLSVDDIPYFTNGLGGASRFEFRQVDPHSQLRFAGDWGAQFIRATRREITYQFVDIHDNVVDTLTVQPRRPCP